MKKENLDINKRLTQKQETFCVKYFELGNATEAAKLAKYSPKTAAVIANENLKKPDIQARLKELRSKTENDAVMSVTERKQHLTKIANKDLDDTSIRAVDILNKMDRIYTEGVQININNAQVAALYREALTQAEAEYEELTEGKEDNV